MTLGSHNFCLYLYSVCQSGCACGCKIGVGRYLIWPIDHGIYRDRKEAIEKFKKHLEESGDTDKLVEELWKVITIFEKYPFYTMRGFRFTYQVKGNEMFVSRKEKSITRSSVLLAMKKAIELQNQVKGPKQLESFGASYLYPIFLKFGLSMPFLFCMFSPFKKCSFLVKKILLIKQCIDSFLFFFHEFFPFF